MWVYVIDRERGATEKHKSVNSFIKTGSSPSWATPGHKSVCYLKVEAVDRLLKVGIRLSELTLA
jgi:hypothetical protein